MADTQINGTLSLKDTDISGSLGIVNPIEANLTPEPEVSSQLMASRTIALPSVLNDLGDVDISSPQQNEILTYNGSKWVNGQGGSGGGTWGSITGTLSDQTDLQNALNDKANTADLAAVATSGSYDDLTNKPTIPAAQIQSDWNQTDTAAKDFIKNKPSMVSGIPEEELRDTVGWTCKNLLQIPNSVVSETKNGITFTVYRDNSGEVERININGTASADTYKSLSDLTDLEHGDYTLSKGSNNSDAILRVEAYNNSTYVKSWGDMSSESKMIDDVDYDGYNIVRVLIKILSGKTFSNVSIYPMLRKSSVTDADYEPYHDSVEDYMLPQKVQNVMGAKNLLKITASTQTVDGVTFTVNSDGSVTANGTASAQILFQVAKIYEADNLILSGCAKTGTSETYDLRVSNFVDYGDGVLVDHLAYDASGYGIYIVIRSGYVASNKVFYPMLRLAEYTDDTYVPYAMTNKELTEKLPFELIRTSVTESSGNNVRIPAGSDTDSRITTSSTVIPTGSVAIKYSAVNVYNGYATITLAESITSKDVGIIVINH